MGKKATVGELSYTLLRELESCLPTPVRRLRAIESRICSANGARIRNTEVGSPSPAFELWLKEDGFAGVTYGGNKTRKLCPLLGRALEKNKQRLVTVGAAGSHHVLATTWYARRVGLKTRAFLTPQIATPHVVETLRCSLAGGLDAVPIHSWSELTPRMLDWKRGDAWIGPGGMGGLGATGYVQAAFELARQVSSGALPEPDWIVMAVGSGSSVAGLIAGLARTSLRTRVRGVLAARNPAIRPMVLAQALAAARQQGRTLSLREASRRIVFDENQVGGGYGVPTVQSHRAIELAKSVGLQLDHTYTAKAFSSLQQFAAQLPAGSRIVFWNTLSAVSTARLLADAPEIESLGPDLQRLLLPIPAEPSPTSTKAV